VKYTKVLSCLLIATAGVTACKKAPAPETKKTAAPAQQTAAQTPAQQTPGQQAPGQQAPAQSAQAAPGQPPAPQPVKPVPQQLPEVVARVNGEDVKKAAFEQMLRSMEMRAGQPIPPERRDEILRGALDQLVVFTLLQQESKNRHIAVPDAEINQRIEQFRGQFPNQDAFEKALKARGMSMDTLKHDALVDLSVTKLMDAEMANQAIASDQECKDFYAKNPDKFKQGESVRASHILVRVDPKADAATRKKARAEIDSVLKQARSGGDFAKLAQEHSQDGSAAQGGDLNYFGRGQMVPEFEKAAFSLKPGQISDVVQTQFGYHIIKVTDHKEPRTVPFDEASGQIKQFLTEQRKQQHADEFIAELKKKSKIEVLI
jgi:peptidyl-prolyl cis-trans isomerase C